MTERLDGGLRRAPVRLLRDHRGAVRIRVRAPRRHPPVRRRDAWSRTSTSDGRPVPAGEPGARMLVTNLHNRVQPIIRLAVSDVHDLHPEPCPCGRPLVRAAAIEGRSDDVLSLPARAGGAVTVLPAQFAVVSRDRGVREFQVRQEPGGLRVLVVPCAGARARPRAAHRGGRRPGDGRPRRRRPGPRRAPRRAGAPRRQAADRRRATAGGISLPRRERPRASHRAGGAQRSRARGVARPGPRPRRAREGARRRARRPPRPAAVLLRGAALAAAARPAGGCGWPSWPSTCCSAAPA